MLVLQIKRVIILKPMDHAIENIFGLEFHLGNFAENWFVHFGGVNFVLLLDPYIHHVNPVFGVLNVL